MPIQKSCKKNYVFNVLNEKLHIKKHMNFCNLRVGKLIEIKIKEFKCLSKKGNKFYYYLVIENYTVDKQVSKRNHAIQ